MPDSYLGRVYKHPTFGEGVITFEEDWDSPWRILLISFAESTQEVIPERLTEFGFAATGERLSLPSTLRRLPGHDAVSGQAVGVREALGVMREKEMVA